MSGAIFVGGAGPLVEDIAAFAQSIEPERARWEYALKTAQCLQFSKSYGEWVPVINQKTIPALARVLGVSNHTARNRLSTLVRLGWSGATAAAEKYDSRRVTDILKPYFAVGTLPAWSFGHVYFARVESHPHVLKIGFSRRVRERLDDIASKHKTTLIIRPGHLKVGTQADEYWWHTNWARHHIAGEWFFDSRSTERSLPRFLQMQEAA